MAQKRSIYLHRIPYSMIWNNAVFDFTNPWSNIFNNIISKTILNSFINYSNKLNKKNWSWNDLFFSYNSYFKNKVFKSKLNFRINNNFFFNKNSILKNSNKGTNLSIQGKTNFFDYNNNLYCLNSYYLQNFSRIKKTKKIKNKNFFMSSYNKNISYIFQKHKILYKQIIKHDYKKINEYKSLLKNLIINKNKKLVTNIKLIENNYFYFYKQSLINYYKTYFLHFFNDNFFLLNKKTKNEEDKPSDLKKKSNKKIKNEDDKPTDLKKKSSKKTKQDNNNENSINKNDKINNIDNKKIINNDKNNSNNENLNNNDINNNDINNNDINNNDDDNNNKKKTKKNKNEDNNQDKNYEKKKTKEKQKKKSNKNNNVIEEEEETLEIFLKNTLNYYNGEFNVEPDNNVSELKRKELVEILRTNIDENLKYILKEILEENSSDIIKEILSSRPNEVISNLLRNKKIPKFKYILAESLYENNEENPFYEEEISIENEENLVREARENWLKNNTEKSTIINLEIGPNHRFYVDNEKKEVELKDDDSDEKYEFNDVFYDKEIDYNYINHKYNRRYYNDDDYENFQTEFKNIHTQKDNLSEFDDDDSLNKK